MAFFSITTSHLHQCIYLNDSGKIYDFLHLCINFFHGFVQDEHFIMVLSVFLLVTTQSVKLSSLRQAFTIELNGNAIRGSGNSLATLI